uniref:Fibrinogen C-terminal domain-containing protein n=1 Tax=Amphimedon queenslandica TaxID=400682 RepID=A0A1X7UVS6_AMPQE
MEGEQSQVYESLNRETINEDNVYELSQVVVTEERRAEERRAEQPENIKKRKNKWNKPVIHTVLLSLIVILQVGILCLLLVHIMSTRDTTCTCTAGATTGATASNNEYPNFTQWANDIVSKVNSNVTGSLPDFTEWSNGVVSKVNSNVTGSLPDFNEWANGVSQNTLQLFQNNTNFTELDKQTLKTTRDSAQKLINIVNTLSNLQDTSTSTAGVADDILLIAQELLVLHNDPTALPTSCKELKSQCPSSSSGYYILASTNGSTTYTAYCNMGLLCGSGGGWTRLAYLDMSDATQNCPSGFRLYQSGGVRACGRNSSSGGSCVSVQFPSNGISYSQICGRVTGYQFSHTDGLHTYGTIDSTYLEGVSITRGSPRQHVWSLISGIDELSSSSCPCNTGSSVSVQSFIGNHYFCESGNPNSAASYTLYTSDPLWDGQGCGSLESPCCNVPGIPWFHRDYGSTITTDYIELRVCGDYHANAAGGEDSPVSYYEIYVKQ